MNLLIVDDEESLRFALSELFKRTGYKVTSVGSSEEALGVLQSSTIDIAIVDYHLPGLNGVDLLKLIKENYSNTQVIIITAYGSEAVAINAIKLGAYDYVTKPFDNSALLNRVGHIRDTLLLKREDNSADSGFYFSGVMHSILDKLKNISVTDIPVLVTGESGTGKELIAAYTHRQSGRKGNFVTVNCSALPASLIESELFGYEKGSFTGSAGRKSGFFELADNGTIFLDEIGEMPVEMQAKLLRVLQEGEITRIGGGMPIKINSRVIAATNRNIKDEIKAGRFREDLYYRLNVFEVKIPPLRERRDEIIPLALAFIGLFNTKYKKNIAGIEKNLSDKMTAHDWKGNIRELKNRLEEAVVLTNGEWINSLSLTEMTDSTVKNPSDSKEPEGCSGEPDSIALKNGNNIKLNFEELPLNLVAAKKEVSESFERLFILHHLNKNGWSVKDTAEIVGLCRQDLYKKMRQLGIQKEVRYSSS